MKTAKWYYIQPEKRGYVYRGKETSQEAGMGNEFREIDPDLVERIKGNAWSIRSMEAHGAGERATTYVGSRISGYLDNDSRKGRLVFDYYQDRAGAYWFKNRALLPDGEIVSMDRYIFGRELGRYTHTRRRK